MFRISVCVAVCFLLTCPALNAQQQTAASTTQAVASPGAPAACPHLFTAGSSTSSTFIQYCVTDVGAITSVQTPFGHFHMGIGGEGYGLCQESPAVEYHDYAATWSDNWDLPQILSLTSGAIKISRTISDGNWTLVQMISKIAATGSIKIVMALTNNQSVDKVAYLVRFADVNPDGNALYPQAAGASVQSAFAWSPDPRTLHYGLQLENTGKWTGYQQGFVQSIYSGPNACAFAFNAFSQSVYVAPGMQDKNTSLVYAYVGAVPALKTITVTLNYRGT
jgi:hypothetical protein